VADALTVIGLIILCVGIGLWSLPGALATGGGLLFALGLIAARAERPAKPAPSERLS
jgi:hypothetical protein